MGKLNINHYKIEEGKNFIKLIDSRDFNPKDIFECGQAFRWKKEEDSSYTNIAYGKIINVKKEGSNIIFRNTNMEDFKSIWFNYFDLSRDYGEIKKSLSKDPILKKAIHYGDGIRILNQDPFEIIISFIISANNQIPRIKGSIGKISQDLGEYIGLYMGEKYYSFPSPDKFLSLKGDYVREKYKVGFRADRILETSRMIYEGEIDIDCIYTLSREESKDILMNLPGVGPKVSDCILLFSYGKQNAFPVDVWVKRLMEYFYLKEDTSNKKIEEYGQKLFGDLSGFAQQYLFYYGRELGIGRKK